MLLFPGEYIRPDSSFQPAELDIIRDIMELMNFITVRSRVEFFIQGT